LFFGGIFKIGEKHSCSVTINRLHEVQLTLTVLAVNLGLGLILS